MRQLGAIASQLLNLRLNKIGSLFEDGGNYPIGKCLSPAFIFHDRVILGDDIPRGPFICDSDYYKAMLSAFLLHIQELQIQQNIFFAPIPQPPEFKTPLSSNYATCRWNDLVKVGGKIDSAKNRLDYYTAGRFLQEMISFISGDAFALLLSPEDGFPLYHHDLSTGNIFVDDDFNITCIIDWAFASTVPISTLLITPGLPNPRDDTDSMLDSAFRSGFIDHHFHGKGTQLPPKLWETTRRARLFTRLTILDGLQDYRYFKELYTSIYQPPADDELNISQLFKTAQKEDHLLVELSRTLREDERSALEVSEEEEEYFAVIGGLGEMFEEEHVSKLEGIERHAIARKITLASELSRDFVADARLWRWIEEAIGERPTGVDVNDPSVKSQ